MQSLLVLDCGASFLQSKAKGIRTYSTQVPIGASHYSELLKRNYFQSINFFKKSLYNSFVRANYLTEKPSLIQTQGFPEIFEIVSCILTTLTTLILLRVLIGNITGHSYLAACLHAKMLSKSQRYFNWLHLTKYLRFYFRVLGIRYKYRQSSAQITIIVDLWSSLLLGCFKGPQ